jgi:cytoskeleton protein RodZ
MTEVHDIRASATAAGGTDAPNVRLSQARQAQNLSTAEVARRLKLSVWQVEALESGQYQQLPGPVFVRGFIRNYARMLHLDPEQLVQSISAQLPEASPHLEGSQARDIPFPAAGTRRWPRYAAAAAVVVALLAVYEFYFNEERETKETPTAPVAAATPKPERQPAAPAKTAREPAGKVPATAAAAATQGAAPATATIPAPASATPPPERVAHPDDREVRFVFEEESWVEIRDRNDQTIFSQLNRAGTTRRVVGLPPLHVVVGNAQGVRMSYAGREVDLKRHTKIDVARLTLE